MGGLLSPEVPRRSLPGGAFQSAEDDGLGPRWFACLPVLITGG